MQIPVRQNRTVLHISVDALSCIMIRLFSLTRMHIRSAILPHTERSFSFRNLVHARLMFSPSQLALKRKFPDFLLFVFLNTIRHSLLPLVNSLYF